MHVWKSNKQGALWVTHVAFISPSLAVGSNHLEKERDLLHWKTKEACSLLVYMSVSIRFLCRQMERPSGWGLESSSGRGNGKRRVQMSLCSNQSFFFCKAVLETCIFDGAWSGVYTCTRECVVVAVPDSWRQSSWSLWRLQRRERVARTLLSNNKQQPSR